MQGLLQVGHHFCIIPRLPHRGQHIMIYVSIDIETTGLDPDQHQILEIGAILEDTNDPKSFEESPKFRALIPHEVYCGSAVAIHMNTKLFQILGEYEKIRDKGTKEEIAEVVAKHSIIDIDDVSKAFGAWLRANGISRSESVNVAGKNFGLFDYQFLRRLPEWGKYVRLKQRVLDPAILLCDFTQDKALPSLSDCKKRLGLPAVVAHTALEDAWDVITTIRYFYEKTLALDGPIS
jgi:oligoribonuclease